MRDKPDQGQEPKLAGPQTEGRPEGTRIAKFLARAGIESRRGVERMIEAGRITVDGTRLTTPAFFVTGNERIAVDGNVVEAAQDTRLWRYHKPTGLVTSHADEKGRDTVFDAMPDDMPRVISVGRLDLNSEGLLLLTNDGALARKLELPKTGWTRTYKVRAYGQTDQKRLDRLAKGVMLDGRRTGPIMATLLPGSGNNVWIKVQLTEGKNREVRRAMESIDLQVNRLIRTSFGPFELGGLAKGALAEISGRQLRAAIKAGPHRQRRAQAEDDKDKVKVKSNPDKAKPSWNKAKPNRGKAKSDRSKAKPSRGRNADH
ncbi:MAG: pseudouridine synthase [Robiginitomaculum sp.]|nr:MAG: pseudouridine synthase [Robiginitomaculum sp.]